MPAKKPTNIPEKETEEFGWNRRLTFMYSINAFCVGVISYVLLTDMDSRVAETATLFAFVTLISTMGTYVFNATWQDVTKIRR